MSMCVLFNQWPRRGNVVSVLLQFFGTACIPTPRCHSFRENLLQRKHLFVVKCTSFSPEKDFTIREVPALQAWLHLALITFK